MPPIPLLLEPLAELLADELLADELLADEEALLLDALLLVEEEALLLAEELLADELEALLLDEPPPAPPAPPVPVEAFMPPVPPIPPLPALPVAVLEPLAVVLELDSRPPPEVLVVPEVLSLPQAIEARGARATRNNGRIRSERNGLLLEGNDDSAGVGRHERRCKRR